MTAALDIAENQLLSMESPVVRGRSILVGCPGCGESPCVGRHGCVWESHVVGKPRFANAVLWHKDLVAKAQIYASGSPERANHDRVVCLLCIVIQASAHEPLFEWLLDHLRPSEFTDGSHPEHPHWVSTRGFGDKFSKAIPPPPESPDELRDAHRFAQQWSPLMPHTSAADKRRLSAWGERMTKLLANLQTNLFYLDQNTIGMYRDACQLQHSCRPNACVQGMTDGALIVRSLRPLRKGERVSFCYMNDGPVENVALCEQMPLETRRKMLEDSAGFICRCEVCEEEERIRRSSVNLRDWQS